MAKDGERNGPLSTTRSDDDDDDDVRGRTRERNVDSRIQVQLEEDGGGSTRQSWMETSGLWTMFHQK